jgi:NAD(P) transhydrogenase subunit beta
VQQNLINIAYLVASVLFILGVKGLTSPRTAVRGNLLGAMGMLVAVVATLLDQHIVRFELILAGVVVGAAIGVAAARKVPLTSMPELVALFNGFGGGASALVAATAVLAPEMIGDVPPLQLYTAGVASAIIGAATLTGSLVAWAKLQGVISMQPRGGFLQTLNFVLIAGSIGLGIYYASDPTALWAFWGLTAAAALYGVLFTVPVGGADMPVVIAILNSASGLAAAATGFVFSNNVLIISGSLVGASGFILTQIMCRAMNRSLWDVLSGDLGDAGTDGPTDDEVYQGRVKSASAEEAVMILESARSVTIVPGYGMAVAQAQHAVRDLANKLKAKGVKIRYGVHPVAGRMPGHMNVLLAEADIPYDELFDMDQINPTFAQTDVVIVLGANDVVNPAARDEPASPIYGMPILDVDKAQTVMVIKRSLSPGFAGIPNRLFAADNSLMLYGDGEKVVRELLAAFED